MDCVVELELVIPGPLKLAIQKIEQQLFQLCSLPVRPAPTLLLQRELDLTRSICLHPARLLSQPSEEPEQRPRRSIMLIALQTPKITRRHRVRLYPCKHGILRRRHPRRLTKQLGPQIRRPADRSTTT